VRVRVPVSVPVSVPDRMCIAVHRGRVSPLYFFNFFNDRVTDANVVRMVA
jgi:hypothetical protein